MLKQEFLTALSQGLSQLPQEEIQNHLEYYEEMIADRMEDGMTEEAAVEALGDPWQAARQILEETPLHTLVKTRIQPKKGWTGTAIALAIIGAPLWISLAIAAVSMVGAIYLTVWSLAVSFYAVVLSLGVAGVAGLIGSFVLFGSGWGTVLIGLGLSILCLALCCLGIPAAWYMTKGLIRGTGWSFRKIKTIFVKQ